MERNRCSNRRFVDLMEEKRLLCTQFLADLRDGIEGECRRQKPSKNPEPPWSGTNGPLAKRKNPRNEAEEPDDDVAVEKQGPDVRVGPVDAANQRFAFAGGFQIQMKSG